MKLDPGALIAGRYAVMERIGVGGMAVVYRAKDKKLDRSVTLKVMREELLSDHEFTMRFQVEARAAASLSNPNIVNVYDVGQDNSVHFIVMEYIDGVTLKELILKKAPLRNEEILGVAMQIASGLAHAHQNGVIHRDIKPQNIMVTTQGAVKVMDFGIARAANGNTMTTTGNTMGSVHYFSPEQARGVYVDQKSDIYSLGIVMFEMATGVLPFDGETAVAVALKQIDEPLPDIKGVNPGVTDDVVNIIRKAASKNTAQRYQSTEEVLADIKQALKRCGAFAGLPGVVDSPTIRVSLEEMAEIQKEHKRLEEQLWGVPTPPKAPRLKKKRAEPAREHEKALERRVVMAGVITSVVIIGLIISLAWYLFQRDKTQPIPAPYVVNMTLDQAREAAREAGEILIMEDGAQWDENVEAGRVISQNVPQDELIHPGEAIHVIISKGSYKIIVPDAGSKEEKELEDLFGQAGLAYNVDYEFSDRVAQGIVISQYPEGNTKVDPDISIGVIISKGPIPRSIPVPNIVDKTEAAAIQMLQDAELVVGPSSKAYSSTIAAGRITAQTVKAGTLVNKGTVVSFEVSLGTPEPTPVPSEQQPLENSKPLLIESSSLPAGIDPVHLCVYKIVDGSGVILLDKQIPLNQFPYELTVSGTGIVEFLVFWVAEDGSPDSLLMDHMVNFEEE
ncbi:MAG: Stk1 family PASTA domain-containing Ser/Thr kinase [Clostridiales bacterium]|jgi:serine/threonine-protein kinase|nr:Stk1 family PASTA domain-containing Ser/Thr kinase [Clostridiales bacterium]